MSTFKLMSVVAFSTLVLTACGDDLTAQAKKAAADIAAEAKKTAAQKIEETKNGAIDQLKQIRVEPAAEKDKKSSESDTKIADEKGK